ncbi:uncharacterized protein si:ch73-344o19.1 isoform X2 [Sardina pilchardus]|uniref:uncharacterized protein si:ch73-344o19.1 isoform X2 n=1 Tax=Sardina pilchardus TaxID=27697 RepID=UPI002E14A092
MNMKTTSYIFVGALVILSNPGKLSGHTTKPPHTEPPTAQSDVGAPHSITASLSSPRVTAGEAASSAPPQEQTSHHAATLPSPSEATHVTTALSPELSSVSGGRTDAATLHTTASLHTLSVLPQNDSSLGPKPVPFTASSAVVTSVPPGRGITPTELTTIPAAAPNQTESNHLNTDTSALAILPIQTTPQSTHIPVSSQTTRQPTTKSVPVGTAVEITSLPPTPSPTQLLTTEAPQTPDHLSVAPPKQQEPPQLDVGDEAHEGHHPASPLDPILAGLVSVFIVCTAIASVMLFLKFRQRNEHPEFHRLHDLPMDDLLEDTPLSRYTY